MERIKTLSLKLKLVLLIIISFTLNITAAITPEQVAQKTTSLISGSKGLTVSFNILSEGRTIKGEIKTLGNKFYVSLPEMKIWYNGKDMYTYNSKTNETTVVKPTAQEILESNPLLYIKTGLNYNYSFSPNKIAGRYSIDVTPKGKRSDIKKLNFIVNEKDYQPQSITVTTNNGSISIQINSFKPVENIAASTFEYPASTYKNAEIIDLR